MTNALGDLLPKDKYREPPEVRIIKDFVREKYGEEVDVIVRQDRIVVQAPGAALAGTLRPRLHELQDLVGPHRRLVLLVR